MKKEFKINAKQFFWLQAVQWYQLKINQWATPTALRHFAVSSRVNEVYESLAFLHKEGYLEQVRKGQKFVRDQHSCYHVTWKGKKLIETFDKKIMEVSKELFVFGRSEF
jgi:hypothetical protein